VERAYLQRCTGAHLVNLAYPVVLHQRLGRARHQPRHVLRFGIGNLDHLDLALQQLSAIVTTVNFLDVETAMKTLDRFDGATILQTTLKPEIAARLAEIVKD
jgi:hypothetical protein